MKGDLLEQMLTEGQKPGSGSYLQATENVSSSNGTWEIDGKDIKKTDTYLVAMNDYLATGKETELRKTNLGLQGVELRCQGDIRRLAIEQLKAKYLLGI